MDFLLADPADEGRHAAGVEPLWGESWYFDFTTRDASLGGYVRLGLYPNLPAVWYWACLVDARGRLVMAVDHEVPLPSSERSLEVRAPALWADHNCEEPLERWSLGLETHAVELGDPRDAYGDLRGHRVPFGFELEWETEGVPFRYEATDRYEIPCHVHGEIRVGDEQIELRGPGQRDHSWGVRDWWQLGWVWAAARLDDGTRLHATSVRLPGFDWATGYWQEPDDRRAVEQFVVRERVTGDGLVADIEYELDGQVGGIEPVAWAPVLLESAEGERSYFARAMSRFSLDDGRSGVGWVEFNQPQPAG